MPRYNSANVPPGYQVPSPENIYMSGGQQMAPGHQYYDPAQDPNWIKPNAKRAAGREKGNQKDYFKAELAKKYGGKIPPAFQDDVEKYGWKPGSQYSYKERIRNKETGEVEEVTRVFKMPAGSTIEQYTNQGYTPSNNYKAAYDPYGLKGQDPTLGQEFTVSPYGSTQKSNQQQDPYQVQQGGQKMANQQTGDPMLDNYIATGRFPNTPEAQEKIKRYRMSQGFGQQFKQGDPRSQGMQAFGNQATDPYQLPNGGRPQISTQPPTGPSLVGPNAGPRPLPSLYNGMGPSTDPYQFPTGPYQNPTFAPKRKIPQSSFGQQNPTIFNQHFANTPYGRSQMQNMPQRSAWGNPGGTPWGQ